MSREPRVPRALSGLICGPTRGEAYRQGHRAALRAAVAFLHSEAARMTDPAARARLNGAAFAIGTALRLQRAMIDAQRRPPDGGGAADRARPADR